jgi:hypothetical protein
LVKKATSFVQKNHWGSSTEQNELMFVQKQTKRQHECNRKNLQSAFP